MHQIFPENMACHHCTGGENWWLCFVFGVEFEEQGFFWAALHCYSLIINVHNNSPISKTVNQQYFEKLAFTYAGVCFVCWCMVTRNRCCSHAYPSVWPNTQCCRHLAAEQKCDIRVTYGNKSYIKYVIICSEFITVQCELCNNNKENSWKYIPKSIQKNFNIYLILFRLNIWPLTAVDVKQVLSVCVHVPIVCYLLRKVVKDAQLIITCSAQPKVVNWPSVICTVRKYDTACTLSGSWHTYHVIKQLVLDWQK